MNAISLTDEIVMTISYVFTFVPSMMLLYFPFHKVMKKKDKLIYFGGSIAIVVMLSVAAFLHITNFGMQDVFYKTNSAFFYILTMFLLIYCCKEKKAAVLFNFGTIGIVLLTISGITSYVAEQFPVKWFHLEMNLLYFGVFALVSIPFIYYIKHNTKLLLSIEKGGEWNEIWFLPVSIMVACAFSTPIESHVDNILDVLCRVTCGVFAIAVSQYLSHSREAQTEKHRLRTELNSQKEYYKEISRKLQQDRKVRHDFRHAIAAIRTYIDEDNKDGLVAYCEKLLDNSNVSSDVLYSGNSVADGILYRYKLLCEEGGIQIHTDGILSDDIIDDMDLCLLLGNALENAYEACQRMNGDKKWIKVKLEESSALLSIAITNSFDGKVSKRKDKFLSSKRRSEPGFGLQSIREICEKYNGTLHITYDEDEFDIMMLLNVNKKEK